MRQLSFPKSFDPATGALDCSNIVGFLPHGVVAIIDDSAPTRPLLYDLTTPWLGFAAVNGTTLTLAQDTSALSAGDLIKIWWDDGQSYGDLLLAIADLLSPATLAINLAALPKTKRAALAAALMTAIPDVQNGDAIPNAGAPYVDASGLYANAQ